MRLIQIILLLSTAAATAQNDGELHLSIGAGVIAYKLAYREADVETEIFPLIELRYKRLSFEGIIAAFSLAEGKRVQWKLVAQPAFQNLERKEGTYTEGLFKRERTMMVGTQFDIKLGSHFSIVTAVKVDPLGKNEGTTANFEISRAFILAQGRTILVPSVGANWQNEDYNNYYYGVTPEEELPGRNAFQAEAGTTYSTSFFMKQKISERVNLLGLVSYSQLADQITESPIVKADNEIMAVIGFTWKIK